MALHWDLTKIENYKEVCWQRKTEPFGQWESLEQMVNSGQWYWSDDKDHVRQMHPITDALIWGSMSIGMGEITEKNHEEVFLRYDMQRRIFGARLRRWDEDEGKAVDVPITLEHIRSHIGLWMNVSKMSKAQYKNQLMRNLREKAEGTLESQQRESAGGEE